ncbi:hypothetical protein BOX15_Mlig032083g2 [Macrostomum lignano]|uniref:Uncharacterized protein n=1 Tax=Macrostomum lignano TaxID=282301 RepID=A0A267DTJ0_9PLAT|nr:hypothetical protein BOX15_Mlig032083g2 [Macrostomum lignano]
MKDSRLRRHPLVALRDRLRGGPAAKRNSEPAAVATATQAASASTATSWLARAPHAPLYYLPPVRAVAGHTRPGPQLLSDQLYETVHPLLFSSASPSLSGIASSGGDSLVLGGGANRGGARAAADGSVVFSVANSSVSTRPDSGESAGERRQNCDCDFCQRVAAADFSPDVTAAAAAAAVAATSGSDLNRSETIDWYNVSAEIEAAAASAAARSAAVASATPADPSRDRGAGTGVGDSTRELFGDEVRLTLQSSAAVPSTAATATAPAAASSTPHQRAAAQPQPDAQLPGESAMPPYSRQLLARLLAEPSPSTTVDTEAGRVSDFLSPASSSPSIGSFAVNSPLLHNSRCSPLASGGLVGGAPVNPDLAGLDFSSAASSFRLVGSVATPTSTSSLLSATPPPRRPRLLRRRLRRVDCACGTDCRLGASAGSDRLTSRPPRPRPTSPPCCRPAPNPR